MNYPGVSLDYRKTYWQARIRINGIDVHLGYHKDWFDAVCARIMGENRRKIEQAGGPPRIYKAYNYPTRYCPHCKNQIPKISRKGGTLGA